MTDITPCVFSWDGESLTPATKRFAVQADKQFVVGETYVMVPHEERSAQSHAHYFAVIGEAWKNLPEGLADEFPSAEHLRAWALVRAGFADKSVIKCATNADAIECAATCSKGDKIKIVEVNGKIVTVWVPHSQSMKRMGKQKFAESKEGVLRVLAEMIGVEPEALSSNARHAA